MERLVYRPKAYAYIKTINDGIVDISDDIVKGEVSRRVNQVSTAEITIRNDRFRYTRKDGPVFRPMDGITVWLSRIPAFPVQVFTGYLDTTPYYQLYPGTVTLQASCTLKKLEYTFWNPALPYMTTFMKQYGWVTDRATGELYNQTALDVLTKNDEANKNLLKKSKLNDSSIGSLLFATLNRIGSWDPNTIWIEPLPDTLWKSVFKLYKSINKEISFSEDIFTQFLATTVGAAGQGTGNPAAPAGQGSGKIWRVKTSAEDASSGDGWTELSSNGNGAATAGGTQSPCCTGSSVSCCDFATLGQAYPHGTPLIITADSGKSGTFPLTDIGNGSSYAPAIGLTPTVQSALGLSGGESVNIQLANGGDLSVKAGFGTLVSSTGPAKGGPGGLATFNGSVIQTGGPGSATASGVGSNVALYATPFAPGSGVVLTRTDEGVDFASGGGSIDVHAIGNGTVDFVGSGFGSPGQDPMTIFVYTLSDGDHSGQHIYVNEEFFPSKKQGDRVSSGEVIGQIKGGGSIEMGYWNLGTGHPADNSGYSEGSTTLGGREFTNFLRSIGQATRDGPYPADGSFSKDGGASLTGAGSTTTGQTGNAGAAAFGTMFDFPSLADVVEATLLRGERSLMNDQPLLPFIQQLATGSMRSFQSMPNGNFFGYFPDWFGTFSHRTPYWQIDDIEVLDGQISLNDESLVTHMYVVGDTVQINKQIDLLEKVESHGVVTVYNAGVSGWMDFGQKAQKKGKNLKAGGGLSTSFLDTHDSVLQFLQRYGARPMFNPEPDIRASDFELIAAWQKFMQAWSQTFTTKFTFTFMPEVYPGGLVSFPSHGLQMYVEEVLHVFDYETGFTTEANLSSPASLKDGDSSFSRGLVMGDLSSKGSSSGVG